MMKAETWMVGKDAVDKKFADTLLSDAGPSMSLSADKKVLLVAGVRHDVKAFHNIPGTIPVKPDASAESAAVNKKEPPVSGKGRNNHDGKRTQGTVPGHHCRY